MTFRLYSIHVRCGNTRFRGKIYVSISAIWELGACCVADSGGCKRNPLALYIFRPMVAYQQNSSEIENIVHPYRFGPLRHVLLKVTSLTHRYSASGYNIYKCSFPTELSVRFVHICIYITKL